MEWTTTAKELEASGFRVGLDRIVRDFKYMACVDVYRDVLLNISLSLRTVRFHNPCDGRYDLPGLSCAQSLGDRRFHSNRAHCKPDRMPCAVAIRVGLVLDALLSGISCGTAWDIHSAGYARYHDLIGRRDMSDT